MYLKDAVTFLSTVHSTPVQSLVLVASSIRERGFGSRSISSHERIDRGDVVQVLVKKATLRSRFITSSGQGNGVITYFVVGGIISSPSNGLWLVVKPCLTHDGSDDILISHQIPDYNKPLRLRASTTPFYKHEAQYLKLNDFIRKVGCMHDCSHASHPCHFNTCTKTVLHSETTLEGGHFFLLTRFSAYPPRRS